MTTAQSALAVIIGRAGSKGLPDKNVLPVAGRPMICHTIQHAIDAQCIGEVVVSTDGDAIADAARTMGVRVVERPATLARDESSVSDAVRHAVIECRSAHDIVVILYANVPVRPLDLIDRAVDELLQSGADSVQSYAAPGKYHPAWMVRLDEHHRVQPYESNVIHRRQDLPALYIPDGGVIAVRRKVLLESDPAQPHAFFGRDRRGITTKPGEVIDIDSALDLVVAEAILQRELERAICR